MRRCVPGRVLRKHKDLGVPAKRMVRLHLRVARGQHAGARQRLRHALGRRERRGGAHIRPRPGALHPGAYAELRARVRGVAQRLHGGDHPRRVGRRRAPQRRRDDGDQHAVGIDYKALPNDVNANDILLLDDGRIQLKVIEVIGNKVHTEVTVAGKLSNNKGINRLGGGLSAEALTEKDKEDIKTAAIIGVDYLAISFPRCGDDLRYARQLAEKAGCHAMICAKVERAEAVATDEAIDDIIEASDAVMVARGDLGVEIGDAELVGVQKKLIARSRQLNKVVITATQMMESMISSPMPTRAEVMDVANAVLDGTDAVMLSAETAAGEFPVETVAAMARVCVGAETHPSVHISKHRMDQSFSSVSETLALSAVYAANHLSTVKAIVALTESGSTPRLMSRITTSLPIYALSRHDSTLNIMALYRGVKPVFFDSRGSSPGELTKDVVAIMKEKGLLETGDLFIMTYGDTMETVGGTNACKIVAVS